MIILPTNKIRRFLITILLIFKIQIDRWQKIVYNVSVDLHP